MGFPVGQAEAWAIEESTTPPAHVKNGATGQESRLKAQENC
ncbi:hypothetical protein [Bertelyvirus sp.]|nr:hypothetical protein [Bertelyvirus sp.]WGN97400.1 hypothetical protein [Bertelyvirus sp.]WGN97939.1 hypothetical protein [Bertelyvirus sp.]